MVLLEFANDLFVVGYFLQDRSAYGIFDGLFVEA